MNEALQRIKQARIHLSLDVPFWAQLAFRLDHVLDESIPTACTDGKIVRYSSRYVLSVTRPELLGLLIEEVGHCALGHLWRRGTRNMNRWNKAADQVLWTIIADLQKSTAGKVALSKDCLVEARFAGLCVEEVYHLLASEGSGADYQSPGAFTDPAPDEASGGSDGADDPEGIAGNLEQEWQAAVHAAATVEMQRGQGNQPAWLKLIVETLTEPRIPWTEHVREFCTLQARDDYSFARPNRRHLQRGFILPTLHSVRLGPIVGAFDTSGSIAMMPRLITEMLSELQGVLDQCQPEELRLMDCDTRVYQEVVFLPGEDLRQFQPKGGGGTDFRPVFRKIDERGEVPACLIFLTDLMGEFPKEEPPYPVLWANYGHPSSKAPFGTTIHVSLS